MINLPFKFFAGRKARNLQAAHQAEERRELYHQIDIIIYCLAGIQLQQDQPTPAERKQLNAILTDKEQNKRIKQEFSRHEIYHEGIAKGLINPGEFNFSS